RNRPPTAKALEAIANGLLTKDSKKKGKEDNVTRPRKRTYSRGEVGGVVSECSTGDAVSGVKGDDEDAHKVFRTYLPASPWDVFRYPSGRMDDSDSREETRVERAMEVILRAMSICFGTFISPDIVMPASDIPVPAYFSDIPVLASDTENVIAPKVEATGVVSPAGVPDKTVSVARVETSEQEIEALRARAASAEANVAILRDVLRIAGDRITDLEFQAEDTESRLHQCERGRIQDRARIRRLEEHLGIGQ
nr:homeodomain-like protein [Tanacetum cinerariifolium]